MERKRKWRYSLKFCPLCTSELMTYSLPDGKWESGDGVKCCDRNCHFESVVAAGREDGTLGIWGLEEGRNKMGKKRSKKRELQELCSHILGVNVSPVKFIYEKAQMEAGIFFSYCPLCGEELDEWFREEKDPYNVG